MLSTVAVILTEIEQEPTAKLAFVKLMLVAFASAVTVPPHVLVAPGVAATFILAGKVSVKLPSTAITLGLVTAKFRVVAPLMGIVAAPKLFTIRNGSRTGIFTVTVA